MELKHGAQRVCRYLTAFQALFLSTVERVSPTGATSRHELREFRARLAISELELQHGARGQHAACPDADCIKAIGLKHGAQRVAQDRPANVPGDVLDRSVSG